MKTAMNDQESSCQSEPIMEVIFWAKPLSKPDGKLFYKQRPLTDSIRIPLICSISTAHPQRNNRNELEAMHHENYF